MRPRAAPPASPHAKRRASAYELTRNSILRISDAKTIQLIQELEKRECLWNTNLPDYPNKQDRLQATAEIVKILNIHNFKPEHVTMKFKNLRNSYCQELKKMAMDENYRPRVFWFKYMDKFIKPHLQKINTYMGYKVQAQIKSPETNIIKTEIISDDDQDHDWAIDNTRSEASCSNSVRIESTYSERSQSENGENSNQSQPKKRKLSIDSTVHDEHSRRQSENGEYSDPFQNSEFRNKIVQIAAVNEDMPQAKTDKKDFCDSFALYIASLLRMLPPRKALRLQPKIVDLIVSEGLEEVNDSD